LYPLRDAVLVKKCFIAADFSLKTILYTLKGLVNFPLNNDIESKYLDVTEDSIYMPPIFVCKARYITELYFLYPSYKSKTRVVIMEATSCQFNHLVRCVEIQFSGEKLFQNLDALAIVSAAGEWAFIRV